MLDFRLETFLTVCDTMNCRKAAELLHITQPAVTQHIRYLEQAYGCRLFDYRSRRLQTTQAACLLEQYARTMKVNEANLRRQLRNRQIRELNIGATKTIGECVIAPYAERFLANPENTLSLIVDNTEHLLGLLDECRLDFALVEGHFDKTRYGWRQMSRESFVGICAEDHPFAGRSVTVEALLGQTAIVREPGSGTRAILENQLLDFNESISHFRRVICISSFPIILDLVRKGYGISFVYEVLARQAGLASFTLEGRSIQREFNFVYLKNTGAEDKIRHFLAE